MRGDPDWQKVLEVILAVFDCRTGTLHTWDESLHMLTLVAEHGVPPPVLEKIRRIPLGKGIAGAAAQRREPVQICNLQKDTSGVAQPGAKATEVEGAIAVPVELGGLLLGTLGIGRDRACEFTANEINDIRATAALIAEKWAGD